MGDLAPVKMAEQLYVLLMAYPVIYVGLGVITTAQITKPLCVQDGSQDY